MKNFVAVVANTIRILFNLSLLWLMLKRKSSLMK